MLLHCDVRFCCATVQGAGLTEWTKGRCRFCQDRAGVCYSAALRSMQQLDCLFAYCICLLTVAIMFMHMATSRQMLEIKLWLRTADSATGQAVNIEAIFIAWVAADMSSNCQAQDTVLSFTYDVGIQKPGDSCQSDAGDGTTDLRGPDNLYEWCQVLHRIHSRPICIRTCCKALPGTPPPRRTDCAEHNRARHSGSPVVQYQGAPFHWNTRFRRCLNQSNSIHGSSPTSSPCSTSCCWKTAAESSASSGNVSTIEACPATVAIGYESPFGVLPHRCHDSSSLLIHQQRRWVSLLHVDYCRAI